jgi:hypothetical protein
LAVGRWPLAVGRWPLAVGRWPLAVGVTLLPFILFSLSLYHDKIILAKLFMLYTKICGFWFEKGDM